MRRLLGFLCFAVFLFLFMVAWTLYCVSQRVEAKQSRSER